MLSLDVFRREDSFLAPPEPVLLASSLVEDPDDDLAVLDLETPAKSGEESKKEEKEARETIEEIL